MGVDGRLVCGCQGVNGGVHAFQIASFCFRNKAEFVQPQPSVDGSLAHGDVVFLAAGEVGQGERFDVRRDQSNLSVDGSARFQLLVIVATDGVQHVGVDMANCEGFIEDGRVENKADFGITCAFHIGDTREVQDGVRHAFMVILVNRDHHVKIADGVLASSCTAGQCGSMNTIESSNFALKGLTVAQTDVQASPRSKSRQQFNAVQHSLLGFGPEAFHGCDLIVDCGLFQTGNGIHTQFICHEFDSLRSEARDAQHFDEPGRCRGMEVDPIVRPSPFSNRLCQSATESFSNALHVVDFTACNQFTEVFAQATQQTTGVLIGADTENVCTLKFEEDGHLVENVGNLVARKVRRS